MADRTATRHRVRAGLRPRELTASALSAMLEHFCYIWLGQGGERVEARFDDERAIDTLATIWVKSVYWLPERSDL
jgi:hypothetical protein